MNIELEKIELIKCVANINNEAIIKKLKAILMPEKKMDETERILANPYLANKINEGIQEFEEGKGVKLDMNNLWK